LFIAKQFIEGNGGRTEIESKLFSGQTATADLIKSAGEKGHAFNLLNQYIPETC
jgi:hypothetical protein